GDPDASRWAHPQLPRVGSSRRGGGPAAAWSGQLEQQLAPPGPGAGTALPLHRAGCPWPRRERVDVRLLPRAVPRRRGGSDEGARHPRCHPLRALDGGVDGLPARGDGAGSGADAGPGGHAAAGPGQAPPPHPAPARPRCRPRLARRHRGQPVAQPALARLVGLREPDRRRDPGAERGPQPPAPTPSTRPGQPAAARALHPLGPRPRHARATAGNGRGGRRALPAPAREV
ncbi:MAG: hypothetical protein AVDCRST_MAG61-2915, partial [uncultured Friedmanniella sp.]